MGSDRQAKRDHAVVIGGSMGGLLAARVLADHFTRVTLVERDVFPEVGENRRGVPQGRHTHGLLASGRDTLERLFPGISNSLMEAGAVSADMVHRGRWFHEGACLSQVPSQFEGLLMSRPLLEGVVRQRLLALPNVRSRQDSKVDGLITTDDRRHVTGVRIGNEIIQADLTVDATGRGSDSPKWLEGLGYSKAREERVEIGIGYATRRFRRSPGELNGDAAAVIPATPEGQRGGVILAQENNTWTVTLFSYFRNYPPSDLPGFIEFARTIPAPYIHEIIRTAEPIGEAATARFPHSLRRRYEALDCFPEGYLVFGDALSSFNPIYGQGMSVSALQSVALEQALVEGSQDLAKRFFAGAAKVIDIPWSIAVGSDLRMPETVGPRSAGVSFINWYMAKLHKAGHHDPVPAMAFHQVANLLAPPPSVMHPKVAMHVLWANLFPPRQLPAERAMSAAR